MSTGISGHPEVHTAAQHSASSSQLATRHQAQQSSSIYNDTASSGPHTAPNGHAAHHDMQAHAVPSRHPASGSGGGGSFHDMYGKHPDSAHTSSSSGAGVKRQVGAKASRPAKRICISLADDTAQAIAAVERMRRFRAEEASVKRDTG